MIDYLQLMNASGMKFGSREQEVSTISRSLKALAKELNIPIIALSQLNRSTESREDKRPVLSDLRESGAIEQDADIVCFIHRPEYYLRSGVDAEGNDVRGMAELIIAKHRSGAVGTVKLRFTSRFARFENWEDAYESALDMVNSAQTVRRESRMNSETSDIPPFANDAAAAGASDVPPFASGGFPDSTMPDIMPGPGDSGVPF